MNDDGAYQVVGWLATSEAIARTWNVRVPPVVKLTLIWFADCPGTAEALAEWAGLSLTEAQSTVDRLVLAGWLEPVPELGAITSQPGVLLQTLIERDGSRCRHCGTEANLSVDHIWPRSRGGGDELDNLQILCRPCNSRKGTRV